MLFDLDKSGGFLFFMLKILSYETLVVSCCDRFTRKRSKVQPKMPNKNLKKSLRFLVSVGTKCLVVPLRDVFFLRVPLPNGLFMSYKWGGDPNHLRYLGWSSKLAATLENLPIFGVGPPSFHARLWHSYLLHNTHIAHTNKSYFLCLAHVGFRKFYGWPDQAKHVKNMLRFLG